MPEPLIDIVLSTYNGERHLEDMISSLVSQSYEHWRLLVRDDGSTDGTLDILEKYAREENRIDLIRDNSTRNGPLLSYATALRSSTAEYTMLCDQDDVWDEDKISKTLGFMVVLEREYGRSVPILVHSDMRVVNEKLDMVSPSFWKYQCLNPETGSSLSRLLTQNVVTGCTMMFNHSLLLRCLPIPGDAVMHDWWIALVACAFGRTRYLPGPTLDYRQHQRNHLGAVPLDLTVKNIVKAVASEFTEKKARKSLEKTGRQAEVFLDRFSGQLNDVQNNIILKYISLGKSGFLKKRWIMVNNRFFKSGFLRNVAFFLRA